MKAVFPLILIVLLFGNYSISAQTTDAIDKIEKSIKADGKYAILAGNYKHFEGSVRTGLRMRQGNPDLQFQIVMIGRVVKEITTDEHLLALVEDCKNAGIQMVICQNAMKALNVTKPDLHPYIETTSSGFLYMFGLQENGFKVVTL
ncbi:MAG: intracellular sulfur oxidation DsrE/DsrF family protein [Spirosomataceae bacterium]|jgi:intracellular sulfur oxidation DsrE/DsrF family protein